MIYSIWNQGQGVYDYYSAGGPQETANAPKPSHLKQSKLGLTPAQASWPLPVGAKKIGSGEFARGRVASSSSRALGSFGIDDLFDYRVLLIGAAAYLWWRRSKR